MKSKFRSGPLMGALTTATLVAMMIHLTSCGGKGDPAPTAQDAMKAKLIGNNWKMQSVSVDGVNQTSVYAGLTIQFTAAGYTTTNGKTVWPPSGTWSITSADATSIKRDDGIEVMVEVLDTTLKLTLTWAKSTLVGGRAESIKGVNVFSFVK